MCNIAQDIWELNNVPCMNLWHWSSLEVTVPCVGRLYYHNFRRTCCLHLQVDTIWSR